MTNPHRPLRFNVGFLLKSPIGTRRDFEFQVPRITLEDDLHLEDLSGIVSIDRTQQGLLLQGKFSAHTDLQCVRCLDDFSQELKWSLSDLYAFSKDNITDSGLLVPDDSQIDLEPLLREYAVLEIPIQPLHKPDCKGLCPVCGENRNYRDCGHRQEPDSPFSSLKDLMPPGNL